MTSLSVGDIFANAMCFHTRDGLLYRSAIRFSGLFETNLIRYYIVGGYALIHHGVVRNTTDIDMIVDERDFGRASQILYDVGYTSIVSDGLSARFEHEHFLPIDLLVSPIFAPNPNEKNRVHFEQGIFFCTLPLLVQTKINAMIGRSLKPAVLYKKMRDHVDICELIVHHDMNKNYARMNNLDLICQSTFERIYSDYFGQRKSSTKKRVSALFKCIL